jgi:tRNA/rRNA methyltransferase
MPGAGTDRTKEWIAGGPAVILVEPQLGENIGAAARAMANFGLSQLRLVRPRDGWPSVQAKRSASGADRILDEARLFDTVEEAIADCNFLFAATARQHDQAKLVVGADEAARLAVARVAAGETVAFMFGRERNGLENNEVGLADAILTLPINPAFASLNLSHAVAVVAYEWLKASGGELPFSMPEKSSSAPKEQLLAFFADLERELDRVEFFRPPEKHATMTVNLRNIITRMRPTQQDIHTLHGIILALAEGRKGPAKGGILDGEEAAVLRVLLAEHGNGRVPSEQGPVRGLARLLRRNPTDAERALWDGLVKDRRFASLGFKRQVPIGPHITDLVSFPLRTVIDLVPGDESREAKEARAEKRSWLADRNYRIIEVRDAEVENDLPQLLDRLNAAVLENRGSA